MDRDAEDVRARWREGASRGGAQLLAAAHGREIDEDSRGMRWSLSPRVAVAAVIAMTLVALVAWNLTRPAASPVAVANTSAQPSPLDSHESAAASSANATERVWVHVSGAVRAPGVVELSAGARVQEAVDAAGGITAQGDASGVNLAREVVDGEQVHVPGMGEAVHSTTINLNRADATELETLPGVGPVLAERIVADREANGPFAKLDDLERVSGVGPAVLAGLAEAASV